MDASELADSLLRSMGSRGRFQLLQLVICSLGEFTAAYQLYGNIFIGKDVPFRCANPPSNTTNTVFQSSDVNGSRSDVVFDECEIVVRVNHSSSVKESRHDCQYGVHYDLGKTTSFMSEFDLVCDRYLLVSLAQTFVVLGQGVGAFFSSIISDRYGRKWVLVGSQLGLLVVGVAIGAAPTFPLFVFFKCLAGMCQQGVVTSINTMGIELFPREHRSLSGLVVNMVWAFGACSMAPVAYLLRHHSWRVLQYALSAMSLLLVLLHFFYLEESLRWLLANGRERDTVRVLRRAARDNGKDLGHLLSVIRQCQEEGDGLVLQDVTSHAKTTDHSDHANTTDHSDHANTTDHSDHANTTDHSDHAKHQNTTNRPGVTTTPNGSREEMTLTAPQDGDEEGSGDLHLKASRALTLLDMFRHKILLFNAAITFLAWFTVAFVVFALYMMSTSYAGDPYLNYFLTALMEIPSCFLLYFGVDKMGRKITLQSFYTIAGIGCLASGICRIFQDNPLFGTLSAVFAMVGMVGGSGAFDTIFFYTTELFPTNFRNQAMGTGSAVGRIGGMIAPFMKNMLLVVVWGPGLITGLLCAFVVLGLHFLPETRGKALPTDIEDVEAWYTKSVSKNQANGNSLSS
ncbi:hypothetical protein ACOMHN_004905 [Nucella lapillus]